VAVPAFGRLCSDSTVANETKTWCGTGWTGQPNVLVDERGRIEVRVNAYDGAYHFLDGETGESGRPPLQTGDLAKGSATATPTGTAVLRGSRDDFLRVIALDRRARSSGVNARTSVRTPSGTRQDGAPLVIDDYLLGGGELRGST
jgi:hypothetical protein